MTYCLYLAFCCCNFSRCDSPVGADWLVSSDWFWGCWVTLLWSRWNNSDSFLSQCIVIDHPQVRMRALCQWSRGNYCLWLKKTRVMAGPECAGTWRRRDTCQPHTSKSSWTAAPQVPWPTYDLYMTFKWLHLMTSVWPVYETRSVQMTFDFWMLACWLLW